MTDNPDTTDVIGIPQGLPLSEAGGHVLDLEEMHATLRPGEAKTDPLTPHGEMPGHRRSLESEF